MIRWSRQTEAQSIAFVNFCREHAIVPHGDNANRYWEYPWAYFSSALRPGMRVLDAGAGHSPFLLHLRQHVPDCEYHAADPCFGYRPPAQLADVGISPSPIEDLDYPDEHFDVSFCLSVLEHIEAEAQLEGVRQLARCTRPGGRVVLTLDYFMDWPSWQRVRESKPDSYTWLPGKDNIDVAALVDASGLVPYDTELIDTHPGQPSFTEAHLAGLPLWSSAHMRPGMRVTTIGVVLYKPLKTDSSVRLTISPEALYIRDDGEPLIGIHLGAQSDPPAVRRDIPRAALEPSGFSAAQFCAWLGDDAEAAGLLEKALRWGALRVVGASGGQPEAVYQPESFIEQYGGAPLHVTRRAGGKERSSGRDA